MKTKKSREYDLPSVSVLKSILDYNPDTGVFFWKFRQEITKYDKTFNIRYGGKIAGSENTQGYHVIKIRNILYRSHRVAWKMYYGVDPPVLIDHVNTNRLDNRISNLREATRCENGRNAKLSSKNTSGFKGVSWAPRRSLWCATITIDYKTKHLGYFEDIEQARLAYINAANKYFGDFANVG